MVDFRDLIGEGAAFNTPDDLGGPQPETAPNQGGFLPQFNIQDPNVQRLLAQMGSGFSQGQPAGQAIGGAADTLIRNKALQGAAAGGSGRQAGFMQQLIQALQGDPLGKNLFGDKDDPNTLNSATIHTEGITIDAPNPFRTRAFGDVSDPSLDSQAQPTTLERTEPDAFPFL